MTFNKTMSWEWQKKHPEEAKAYRQKWEKENPRNRTEYAKNYYKKNRKKCLQNVKEWTRKHTSERRAYLATREMKYFLYLLNLPKDYNIRNIVRDLKISTTHLQNIAKKGGWPDWKEEAIEEKKGTDWLRACQIARAVLEYRVNRKYRVSYRFSSTKQRIFKNIFDFYEWQKGE